MTSGTASRSSVVSTLREVGIIPVIRAQSADAVLAVVEALMAAGFTVAEVTMTVPRAIEAIASVTKRFGGNVLVGAGTVTDAETARRAVDAGVEFIVSPCLVPDVIDAAQRADVSVIPGGFTPTEVFDAYRKGGDMVKIFPVQSAGGAAYLQGRALSARLRSDHRDRRPIPRGSAKGAPTVIPLVGAKKAASG